VITKGIKKKYRKQKVTRVGRMSRVTLTPPINTRTVSKRKDFVSQSLYISKLFWEDIVN
jgi:hypothetical protein